MALTSHLPSSRADGALIKLANPCYAPKAGVSMYSGLCTETFRLQHGLLLLQDALLSRCVTHDLESALNIHTNFMLEAQQYAHSHSDRTDTNCFDVLCNVWLCSPESAVCSTGMWSFHSAFDSSSVVISGFAVGSPCALVQNTSLQEVTVKH